MVLQTSCHKGGHTVRPERIAKTHSIPTFLGLSRARHRVGLPLSCHRGGLTYGMPHRWSYSQARHRVVLLLACHKGGLTDDMPQRWSYRMKLQGGQRVGLTRAIPAQQMCALSQLCAAIPGGLCSLLMPPAGLTGLRALCGSYETLYPNALQQLPVQRHAASHDNVTTAACFIHGSMRIFGSICSLTAMAQVSEGY